MPDIPAVVGQLLAERGQQFDFTMPKGNNCQKYNKLREIELLRDQTQSIATNYSITSAGIASNLSPRY